MEHITDPVEKKLTAALMELMEKLPIDKIPTSQILKRAGVGRSTFYRRYRDKYDLLNSSYQHILDFTLFRVTGGTSYKEAFFNLYGVLKECPSFIKNALSSTDTNGLRNYIYRQSYAFFSEMMGTQGIDMTDAYNHLLLTGYITGTLEVTCIWVQNGMKESLETLFSLNYQLMPETIRTCITLYYM